MTIGPSPLDRAAALAIVPARAGSKGVPGKNLRSLGGRPLLAHAIDVGLDAARVGRVVVSTDSEEIAAVARSRGAEVPFLRPAALAADTSRVADALVDLLERLDGVPETFVLLQPTSPLRTAAAVHAS